MYCFSVGKHLLVGYWGQNSAGGKFPQNPEKDLKDVCAERKYDIIVIGFVVTFFGKNNKGMNSIVSKVFRNWFGLFALLRPVIGLKNSTNQMQNQNQSRLVHTRFPALDAGYMYRFILLFAFFVWFCDTRLRTALCLFLSTPSDSVE